MTAVRCWIGAKIDMPNGQNMSWRCYGTARRAIKVRADSLQAWGKIDVEITYTPVCDDHFTEAQASVEDWLTIEEWQGTRRAR